MFSFSFMMKLKDYIFSKNKTYCISNQNAAHKHLQVMLFAEKFIVLKQLDDGLSISFSCINLVLLVVLYLCMRLK